ncbi:ATP synthase F0 subunit A [Leptotrichia sp. OH3620_COT-345]|uniref:F0F1 ATP synthase subunit A n=1 Tax=Leptotrichia sp. OH3620_COT-345 TaxID=2491048 RepID=UPI000F64785B|nr:F0F1 ATP synthase subunit A [Leptotrichia sp. OH3620_COT-345]RRD40075.1 ATP synthase F0 subunit A [Leptotrichia sp. OH3620_COT-345]
MGKGKKITVSLIILFLMILIVNLILSLISTFLPIKFVMPESLIEAPKYYNFFIGNMKIPISQTVLNTWVIMALMAFIIKKGTDKLSVTNPGKLQIILEEYYHFIENMFLGTFGKYKKKFIPFFSALFAFILFSNLSLFLFPFIITISKGEHGGYYIKPFFRTPTADPNTTIGLSLVVVVLFISIAIKKGGITGYVKSLMHPAWFMLPVNIVGELSKPLNTSMRLFGNMFAGLVIGGLLYSLVGRGIIQSATRNILHGQFSFSVGWAGILQLYFDGFVGLIQAFVFTVLSSVYVSEVLGEEIEEE